MLRYIVYRVVLMIPTLIVISLVSFAIIQLPPGDFLTSYVAGITSRGEEIDEATIQALREVEPGRYAACHFAETLELRGVAANGARPGLHPPGTPD